MTSRFALRPLIALGLLFLLDVDIAQGTPSAPPPDTTHYHIDAEIQPESGLFNVQVEMHFVPQSPTDTLRFLLHEDLDIQNLGGPVGDYRRTPWRIGGRDSLFTTVVALPLSRKATPSDPVSLTWQYDGHLQTKRFSGLGGSAVTPHWIELPVESMWVPVQASLRKRFTFDATLELPDRYEVVSTGTIQQNEADWQIESTVPGPDVPVFISDQMESTTYTQDALSVTLYHAGAPDSVREFVTDHTTRIVDRYAERFQNGRDTDHLRLTLAPVERASDNSYARSGLIALQHGVTPDKNLFGLLAHETAHLWWSDATNPMSRHNFLNESFAEYETWQVLRGTYGEEPFRNRMERARKKADDAPSFSEWTPQHDGALSYNKGPLLLHRLHKRIGEDDYLAFLRQLQREDTGTLGDMVDVLRNVTSPKTATWFEEQL